MKDIFNRSFEVINIRTGNLMMECTSRVDAVRLKILLSDDFGIDSFIKQKS